MITERTEEQKRCIIAFNNLRHMVNSYWSYPPHLSEEDIIAIIDKLKAPK